MTSVTGDPQNSVSELEQKAGHVLRKLSTAFKIYKEKGVTGIVRTLRRKLADLVPRSAQSRWKDGIASELSFWDSYYRTKGLQWSDAYGHRFDADLPIQPRVAALLPAQTDIHILDVGAGPQTFLGKKADGKRLTITAVDPLAEEYDKILAKYGIEPLIRTQKLAAEDLTKQFARGKFDLVVARNCIDHAADPEQAVLQMVEVLKADCYVLMEHKVNEAEAEGYEGLHQWNFSMTDQGEFLIRSRSTSVNMTQKYATSFQTTCELIREPGESDWLIARIQKLARGPVSGNSATERPQPQG